MWGRRWRVMILLCSAWSGRGRDSASRHPWPPAAGLCKIWNGIPGLRPSGAFSLNGPYESKLSTARPTKKHRSFAAMPFRFAVSEGFEPPVRSHVHLFSRQAPSTTRTTHRRRTAKVEIISELSKKPPQSSSSFCHNLLEQMAMSSSWVRVMEECRPVSSKKRSGLRPMVSGQPL